MKKGQTQIMLLYFIKYRSNVYDNERIRERKIITKRANEVGNKIEFFVRDALIAVGYDAQIPSTSKGIHRSAGYPDIVFMDRFDRTIVTYLECKTYNIQNIDTTQR